MTATGFQIDAPARDFGAQALVTNRPGARRVRRARRARSRQWQRLRSAVGRMGPGWGFIVLLVLAADVVLAALAWGLVRLVTG